MPGDIVVAINGKPVKETNEIMKTISRQKPGTLIELNGFREAVPFIAQARVIQRPGRNQPVN